MSNVWELSHPHHQWHWSYLGCGRCSLPGYRLLQGCWLGLWPRGPSLTDRCNKCEASGHQISAKSLQCFHQTTRANYALGLEITFNKNPISCFLNPDMKLHRTCQGLGKGLNHCMYGLPAKQRSIVKSRNYWCHSSCLSSIYFYFYHITTGLLRFISRSSV